MKKILALFAALAVALGITLTASPAQAVYGWHYGGCYEEPGNNALVCINLYTVQQGNGQKVIQMYTCAAQIEGHYGHSMFRGIKNTGIEYFGATGAHLGGDSIVNPNGADLDGHCAYTTPPYPDQVGNQACFKVSGTLNLNNYPDLSFTIKGKVAGGSYDC